MKNTSNSGSSSTYLQNLLSKIQIVTARRGGGTIESIDELLKAAEASREDIITAIEIAFSLRIEQHLTPTILTDNNPVFTVFRLYVTFISGRTIDPHAPSYFYWKNNIITKIFILLIEQNLLAQWGQALYDAINFSENEDHLNRILHGLENLCINNQLSVRNIRSILSSFKLAQGGLSNAMESDSQSAHDLPLRNQLALVLLNANKIETDNDNELVKAINDHKHPLALAKITAILKKSNALNPTIFKLAKENADTISLLICLQNIPNIQDFSLEDLQKLFSNQHTTELATLIVSLKQLNVYDNDYLFLLMNQPDRLFLINRSLKIIACRSAFDNLSATLLNKIINHPQLTFFTDLVLTLKYYIPNANFLEKLLELSNPDAFTRMCVLIFKLNLYDKDKVFNQLIVNNEISIYTQGCLFLSFIGKLIESQTTLVSEFTKEDYLLFKKNNLLKRELCVLFDNCLNASSPAEIIELLHGYTEKNFLSELVDGHMLYFIKLGFEYPQILKILSPHFTKLHNIDFFDNGRSSDQWNWILRDLAEKMPDTKPISQSKLLSDFQSCPVNATEYHFDLQALLESNEWQFMRTQGRTALLVNKSKGDVLAIKVCKKEEKPAELIKEFTAAKALENSPESEKIRSYVPSPLGIINISHKFLVNTIKVPNTDALFDITSIKNKYIAYVYQVDKKFVKYFSYLHDITLSNEEYEAGNQFAVFDLVYMLSRHKIGFPQLADIYHETEIVGYRKDQGRYIVLSNMLNNTRGIFANMGSGRVCNWYDGVAFPNLRATGLADYGDWAPLVDFMHDGKFTDKYLQQTKSWAESKTGNYATLNLLAEYQYVLYLIAGRRGVQLEDSLNQSNDPSPELKEKITQSWLMLANQIVKNCIQALGLLTQWNEKELRLFFSEIVDTERLARQMQFWMTTEYVPFLKQNKLPEDLYPTDTKIKVKFKKIAKDTFFDEIGSSDDGKSRNLGLDSGQEPIKEANKLFYWMAIIICASYLDANMTLKDILNEKSAENLQKKGEKFFKFLPKNQYQATMFTLFSKLEKNQLASDKNEAITLNKRKYEGINTLSNLTDFEKRQKSPEKEEQPIFPSLGSVCN